MGSRLNFMAALFLLSLLLAAALIFLPRFRVSFLTILDRIGDGVMRFLDWADRHRVRALVVVLAGSGIGFYVSSPSHNHDGSAASRPAGQDAAHTAQPVDVPVEASPGSMPPLDYQISAADCIVLAETKVAGGEVSYALQDVWKSPEDCNGAAGDDNEVEPDITSFRMLGYRPENGQLAVLFFTPGRVGRPELLELLPVDNGELTYAPDDSAVKRKMGLDELRQLVQRAP